MQSLLHEWKFPFAFPLELASYTMDWKSVGCRPYGVNPPIVATLYPESWPACGTPGTIHSPIPTLGAFPLRAKKP
jgi:hypothetical protein